MDIKKDIQILYNTERKQPYELVYQRNDKEYNGKIAVMVQVIPTFDNVDNFDNVDYVDGPNGVATEG